MQLITHYPNRSKRSKKRTMKTEVTPRYRGKSSGFNGARLSRFAHKAQNAHSSMKSQAFLFTQNARLA